MSAQRFQELDHLFFGDGSVVQAKADAGEVHPGNHRQVMPVEVKLHHRCFAFHGPGAHPSRTLGESGFVDEEDQSSLATGVFFRFFADLRDVRGDRPAAAAILVLRSIKWQEGDRWPRMTLLPGWAAGKVTKLKTGGKKIEESSAGA
jgi:hypothetical protein